MAETPTAKPALTSLQCELASISLRFVPRLALQGIARRTGRTMLELSRECDALGERFAGIVIELEEG